LLVFADAVGRATSLDHESLRQALAETDMDSSLVGAVTFRPDGSSEVLTVVSQYQEGKPVSIWPPALAAARIVYPSPAYRER
jgi:hypothetical protein